MALAVAKTGDQARMKIDLTQMSTPNLLKLLRNVSREIEARLEQPIEHRIAQEQPVVIVREPCEADKQHCLHVAQMLRSRGYIKAEDRRRVAEIAQEFGDWVIKQGLPTDGGTGSWRKAAEKYSIGFARER